jgi:hypothetical protein
MKTMTKKKKKEDKEREAVAAATIWAKVLARFKRRRMKSIDDSNDSLFYDRTLFFVVD